MNNEEICEAAEALLKAEEVKKDPVMMAAVNKYLEDKKKDISSIQDLRDKESEMPDHDVDPELMTEEDKASIQYMQEVEKKDKNMYGEAKKETKVKPDAEE